MQRFLFALACVSGCLLAGWPAGVQAAGPKSAPSAAGSTEADDWPYTLTPGDNPWTISQRFLHDMRDWPRLVAYNRIADATELRPGRVLRIPRAWLKLRAGSVALVALQGDVQVLVAQAPARAAAVGERLATNAVLRTGAQSSALLRLDDGSTLLLRPDSELLLAAVLQAPAATASGQPAAQTRLELRRGALDNVVSPQGKGGRYEVRTPSSVAGVRGTDFRITADDDASRLEVLGGAVAVGNDSGQQLLAGGTGTHTRRGLAPEPATPLPPPPSLDALPAVLERLPILLPVTAAPQARANRTQFIADASSGALSSDLVSAPNEVRAIDVDDGLYRLQVRSIDARGLEGPVAERRVRVHARPVPPFLLQPAPGAVLAQAQPRFVWTRADAPGRRVRLQISANTDFAAPWADVTLPDEGQWSPTDVLPVGTWHWRVQAIDPQRGPGPWGDAQPLQRVLPAPGLQPPAAEDGRLMLRWPAVPGATGYRVQMVKQGASEPAFNVPALDERSATPQISLATPPPGRHLIRVQAWAGADAGPWSEPQQLVVPEPAPAPNHWPALWLLLPLLLAL